MKSKGYHPEVTDVIFESDKMLELGIVAINNTERGFDNIWYKIMIDFLWKFYKVGIHLAEKHAKERGIKFRLIVEITKENMQSVKSFKYYEIKYIDNREVTLLCWITGPIWCKYFTRKMNVIFESEEYTYHYTIYHHP